MRKYNLCLSTFNVCFHAEKKRRKILIVFAEKSVLQKVCYYSTKYCTQIYECSTLPVHTPVFLLFPVLLHRSSV